MAWLLSNIEQRVLDATDGDKSQARLEQELGLDSYTFWVAISKLEQIELAEYVGSDESGSPIYRCIETIVPGDHSDD